MDMVALEEGIAACDEILCGSGWQSDLEWEAIGIANNLNKRSVVFLDHWVNYQERFVRNSTVHLPSEIWVGDNIAFDQARKCFPRVPLRLVPNPYFLDVETELAEYKKHQTNSRRMLYVCEPIREHAFRQHQDEQYFGYTEETALRFFLENVKNIDSGFDSIVIRKHPAESENKYHWVLDAFDMPIVFRHDDSLVREIVLSDIIVGCESMAMVVGLLAGKRVVSSIPPGGRLCVLPHANIEHLSQMLN
jgi:hypothetical protein